MQLYLVDLSFGAGIRKARPPEPPADTQPLTKQQANLLAMGKRLSRIPDPLSEEGVEAQLDVVFGQGVVPKYQWFRLGDKCRLTADEVAELETQFFGGNEHGYGNIELHTFRDEVWLRIRNAQDRGVLICMGNRQYRLAKAYHYPANMEVMASFPA